VNRRTDAKPRTEPIVIGGKIGELIHLPGVGWLIVREKRGKQITLILTTETREATMSSVETPP
jgi:hypothetical protein